MELAKYKYDQDLASVALSEDPDLIVCAGFTRDLGPSFIDSIAAFTIPAINLHPSLPPADLIENNDAMSDAHRRLKEQGISSTGAMVHEINKRPGRGRPFSWEMIEFEDARDERVETLRERIQRVERKVIVEGTRNAIEFYGLPKTSISPPF
jgi:phosphoribosylglycinamide formyltransferase